jgi:hypothetical protein
VDAIVVHELCHIRELNHSARFWALLDAQYPRHREASAWLDEHGSGLRITQAPPSASTQGSWPRPAASGDGEREIAGDDAPEITPRPPRRGRRAANVPKGQSTLF